MMRFHLLFTCNKEVEKETERSDVGTRQNVRREHFLIDGRIYKRPPRIVSRDSDFSFSEISSYFSKRLTRISHRFLLNGCNLLGNKELWDSAKNSLFLRCCSAETSKRQAREAALSLRSAWSRAPARSRRGSRSVLPRIASRICETSGLNTNGATNRTCRLHRSPASFLPSRYIHVDWLTLDHRQVMNISQEQDLPIGRFRLLTRMSHYRAKQHLAIREAMRGKMIMSTRPTRYWANASPPGRRATLEEGHL